MREAAVTVTVRGGLGEPEYLAAVTRLGSSRRAAELHLSQPALSETIRNLERELGVTLLDRRRSGATVSPDGRELLPHITGVRLQGRRTPTVPGAVRDLRDQFVQQAAAWPTDDG